MNSKLQELTKKLYDEGVVKANQEKDQILDDARKEAESILKKARMDADKIIEDAKNESNQLNNKVISELKLAGDQAMTSLKQKITDLLSTSSLNADVKGAANNAEFVKKIILEIIKKWEPTLKGMDLELILSDSLKSDLEKYFKTEVSKTLKSNVEVTFESRMSGGFKIGPADHSFKLSFTEEDFLAFFQSFLKPRTKEILFGNKG